MNDQLTLPHFSGSTYDHEKDAKRLNTQLGCIADLMGDHEWWTLEQLQRSLVQSFDIWASEASVSARIRDLKKPRFGGHIIERRRVEGGNGLHEYRLLI